MITYVHWNGYNVSIVHIFCEIDWNNILVLNKLDTEIIAWHFHMRNV
jgi:hypothetical protein